MLRMLAHTDTLAFSRYIMYHHPVFSFVLFTTLFFSFEVFVMASIWLLATLYTSPSISSRIAPSLQVEENWVEGVRRGQGYLLGRPEQDIAKTINLFSKAS